MDSNLILGIASIVLIVAIFLIIFIRSRQGRLKVSAKLPFSIELGAEGSKEEPTITPAIRVKGATSREGGVVADDQTGRGIDAEQLDARDDVLLTSVPPKSDQNPKA